jgi:hypothetical protein
MKHLSLLLAVVLLGSFVVGCAQYHMKAWDRNTHEKLGEWYVYQDWYGNLRAVDNDAKICPAQATVILEETLPPKNRMVLRERSEDDR